MSKTSTRIKKRWNKATYKRYEFNLRVDSKLNALVERYKDSADANLSELLRKLLCGYFGIEPHEAEALFSPYYIRPGTPGIIPNNELDKYFPVKDI